MQFREFGEAKREKIVLLHGGGLSWWNYRETAEILKNDFHIVLPILDGHAGSDHPLQASRKMRRKSSRGSTHIAAALSC